MHEQDILSKSWRILGNTMNYARQWFFRGFIEVEDEV